MARPGGDSRAATPVAGVNAAQDRSVGNKAALDYSSHLNPGCLGHNAGNAVAGQPFQAGAPTAQVAYPYYTHRGPRDFLMDNPPSIGP